MADVIPNQPMAATLLIEKTQLHTLTSVSTVLPTTLAIECATQSASIALWHSDTLYCVQLDGGPHTSLHILPSIEALCQAAQLSLNQIKLLLCSTGPGSFTSLRLGITVAQGLAYVHKIPCIAINSLLNIAYQKLATASLHQVFLRDGTLPIDCCLDARMGESYCATYCFANNKDTAEVKVVKPATIIRIPATDAMFLPHASASIGLVRDFFHSECLVTLHSALDLQPTYVRDQVALTMAQRGV